MSCITWILFQFCHFGNRVTQRYEDVGDAVYRMAWYALPLDMQKRLPVSIAISQKRVYVRGGADIKSTRELFIQVPTFHFD